MKIRNKLGLGMLATAFAAFSIILSVSTAEAKICNVGDNASVLWHGKWYPATVLKTNKNQCYIHYNGYNNSWNEWVGANRIRISSSNSPGYNPGPGSIGVGTAVMVLWHGKWYPAHVLNAKGNKLYIHYDGYGSNWDEWVGPGRYRLP